MLNHIIHWSIHNRLLVLLATLIIGAWGWVSLQQTPLDAIPDLSDVQVIIRTSYPGQSPRIVEDQVTYPITTTMLSVPGAKTVRGYSMFGDSFIYVLFEEGTDLYWARSRVLEYLNQAAASLPAGVLPRLGPDATGVGWVYSYALVDRTGRHDIAQLRSLQDWFLKFELQSLPGVAEVATVGGMVKQYQILVDPQKLRAYNLPLNQLIEAVRDANAEVGGSVIEIAEADYMLRTRGYLRTLSDIEEIPIATSEQGTPILLRDLARVRIGPEMRQAAADLDGEGEITGGIIVMRHGENALETITKVKARLEALKAGLPEGVELVETYDRSQLIERAVNNLKDKLIEELVVVALVCLVFLFHLRSALVAVVTLPLGILTAFIIMKHQGINANIMSLGGIAIAIGAMVDAAVVLVENAHKHLEHFYQTHDRPPNDQEHWALISTACTEVGPALFFSLLIITLSFVPVFSLEAQEGRLFAPLAYTKTYAMAAAAGLAVTLTPALIGIFVRGKITPEHKNPLSLIMIAIYRPLLQAVLRIPRLSILVAILLFCSLLVPLYGVGGLLEPVKWLTSGETRAQLIQTQAAMNTGWQNHFSATPWLARLGQGIGTEFMPDLDEGDLMYMPTALPGISIGKARELLQQTDRLIGTLPEVKSVFGKVGRAETATDPAPLNMIETLIQLKPRSEWRPGLTLEGLIAELDARVKIPGLTNAWVMPIKTRIDMLATGIKTPVGVKVAGPDIKEIERIGRHIEQVLAQVPGTASAYSERVAGGRYLDIIPKRLEAARLGLSIAQINQLIGTAVGGITVTETVEGLERYPVSLRFPSEDRDNPDKLAELPLVTPSGAHVSLGQVADIQLADGPPMLQSENSRINGWTFVDIRDRDLGSYVADAQREVQNQVKLPPGYSISWSGQFEYMERAKVKLAQVVPMILAVIFILLFLIFRSIGESLIVMLSMPFALVGAIWFIHLLGYNFSVAVAVGLIALTGVAAEFGVIMLIYLDNAWKRHLNSGQAPNLAELQAAIMEGAVARVRPKAMTVATLLAGLAPIMFGSGTGSEVMRRIAAPMLGGMITAPLLSLFVIPAIYLLWRGRGLK
jgi:Cu(I)/Ag(I) efflux system membrane protein CusA/SilA